MAALVFVMVTVMTMSTAVAWGDTAAGAAARINGWGIGLTAVVSGNTVNVTGAANVGTTPLPPVPGWAPGEHANLVINSGVTVMWNATLTGNIPNRALLAVGGQGHFIVGPNGEISNLGTALEATNYGAPGGSPGGMAVTVSSGGVVSMSQSNLCDDGGHSVALMADDGWANTITIEDGGEVSAPYGFAISVASSSSLNRGNAAGIRGLVFVGNGDAIIDVYGDVTTRAWPNFAEMNIPPSSIRINTMAGATWTISTHLRIALDAFNIRSHGNVTVSGNPGILEVRGRVVEIEPDAELIVNGTARFDVDEVINDGLIAGTGALETTAPITGDGEVQIDQQGTDSRRSGSSGCNAGFGFGALALIAALLGVQKTRRR